MGTVKKAAPQTQEPVFVAAVLEAMFDDAPDVISTVLATFCTSMELQLQLLQEAMVTGNTLAQEKIAHCIKGAARMTGAYAMAQAAEQLELAARSAQNSGGGQSGCDAAAAALALQWTRLPGDVSFQRARDSG